MRALRLVLFVILSTLFVAIPFQFMFFSASAFSPAKGFPKYIDEFEIPTSNSAPLAITVDKKGIVWFTESNVSKLGRFDPGSNSFVEYSVPGVGDMWGIAVDSAGYVWFTQYSGKGSVSPGGAVVGGGHGKLGRFDPASMNFTFFDIPTVGSFPMRLVIDAENRVWFTEFLGNRIGLYDQSVNRLSEYEVPTNASGPADLTLDAQGVLWFTETYAKKVAKFYPLNQTFVEYAFETVNPSELVSSPVGIAADRSGNLWIADHGGNWIVKFAPGFQGVVRYPTRIPSEDAYPLSIPNGLLVDNRERIWFSEHGANSIGYLDPDAQTMVEFPIPTGPVSTALWISLAPNGDLWFTEWSYNKIGVVHANLPVPVSLRASERFLILGEGQDAVLSLLVKVSEQISGNGTFRYSWSSYNPSQVKVRFSPPYPSLEGLADTPGRVELEISGGVTPGNYTLGLGIDAGTVLVSTIVLTEVPPASGGLSFNQLVTVLIGSIAVLVVLRTLLLRRRSSRALHRQL